LAKVDALGVGPAHGAPRALHRLVCIAAFEAHPARGRDRALHRLGADTSIVWAARGYAQPWQRALAVAHETLGARPKGAAAERHEEVRLECL
jgi:hypothetical protein